MNSFFRITLMVFCALPASLLAQSSDGAGEKIALLYGQDRNIQLEMKGRTANIELFNSAVEKEGFVVTDYQSGKGFVTFDRESQHLKTETRIPWGVNRVSGFIQRKAPKLTVRPPKGAELDVNLKVNTLGLGSFEFADVDINKIRMSVKYGDVDINFPTVNNSIVRGVAKFGVMAGDLELYNLANLKADQIKVNGGAGEVTIDFGPKLLKDTEVRIDLDIGDLELIIPKGTRVTVTGTARDLSPFGLGKHEEKSKRKRKRVYWTPAEYSPNSPRLDIKLTGPLGELDVIWK